MYLSYLLSSLSPTSHLFLPHLSYSLISVSYSSSKDTIEIVRVFLQTITTSVNPIAQARGNKKGNRTVEGIRRGYAQKR
jgi:hypothetical protein